MVCLILIIISGKFIPNVSDTFHEIFKQILSLNFDTVLSHNLHESGHPCRNIIIVSDFKFPETSKGKNIGIKIILIILNRHYHIMICLVDVIHLITTLYVPVWKMWGYPTKPKYFSSSAAT